MSANPLSETARSMISDFTDLMTQLDQDLPGETGLDGAVQALRLCLFCIDTVSSTLRGLLSVCGADLEDDGE